MITQICLQLCNKVGETLLFTVWWSRKTLDWKASENSLEGKLMENGKIEKGVC